MSRITFLGRTALLSAATLVPLVVEGQQANPSVAAYAMGDNYTAVARNHEALAWNAAALGLKGNKPFSLGLLGVSSNLSFRPIALSDFGGGGTLSKATRDSWLQQVRTAGTQRGEGMASINVISLSAGRVGFQLSALLSSRMDLNGDAMEALLYGNAGATGQAKTLNFSNSSMRVAGLVTAAGSFAIPLSSSANGQSAIGITGKLVRGAFNVTAQDAGSTLAPSRIDVRFPVVNTDPDHIGQAGSGFGADISFIRQSNGLTLAATVHNALNTFAWDPGVMVSRSGLVSFDGNSNNADFDEKPYESAPAALKSAVDAYVFKPAVSIGMAKAVTGGLTISGDYRQQLGDESSILVGPQMHAGVGLSFTGLGILPIRAGAAYETGGYALSGGAGIHLGPINLGVAARYRVINGASSIGVMFGL